MLKWDDKDPDDVDSFGINWVPRLNGDLIATSTWSVPDGLTQDLSSNSTTSTTVWLSGGTDGDDYEVLNRITTTGGRTIDQTVKLRVRAN